MQHRREETSSMHEDTPKAIAEVHAGRPVVCTLEEYVTTIRAALKRYATQQAAQGHPNRMIYADSEIQRLDAAQATGRWPGTYRSVWERTFVWFGRHYAIRTLVRRYYRRMQGRLSQP